MGKYRILFLLHLPPPVHGSSVVGKFIKDSTIINSKIKTTYINLLASNRLNNTGRITLHKFLEYIGTIIKLKTDLIFMRPKLCYFALSSTGAAFIKDALLVSIIKLFRIPIIYHLHNKGIVHFADRKLYKKLYAFVFKDTKVILLSQNLYSDVKNFVKKKQVVICPNGIPEVTSSQLSVSHKKKEYDIIQFLFVSNLIVTKGIFVLLEACSILKRKGFAFKLVIVGGEGDISEQELTKKIKAFELNKEVTYLGKKYGHDKHNVYQNSDVFVFPTFYQKETLGLVNLEAMQFGLPVISCAEGGITDIIVDNKNGFIVPKKDSGTLAEKMALFIEKPSLIQKMGTKAKENYKSKYTLEIFENRIKKILLNELYR